MYIWLSEHGVKDSERLSSDEDTIMERYIILLDRLTNSDYIYKWTTIDGEEYGVLKERGSS